MNYLSIRKGPELEFIVEGHRSEFENHVIEVYMEAAEGELGYYGSIPSIEDSILPLINRKFILAGLYGYTTGDPSHYINETKDKLVPEFERYWAHAELNRLGVEHEQLVGFSLASTDDDISSVLHFHNMFHAEIMGWNLKNQDTLIVFRNVPIIEVW